MSFELRVPGRAPVRFEDEHEAVAAARDLLRVDPNADVDLFDLSRGAPYAPGSSRDWREDLWNSVGY